MAGWSSTTCSSSPATCCAATAASTCAPGWGKRCPRLLLDEFQDTDPIQVDLAVLIASDDPQAAGKPWWDIPVAPGRLFFVGDPKQSIYRFRRADINLFLQASGVLARHPWR